MKKIIGLILFCISFTYGKAAEKFCLINPKKEVSISYVGKEVVVQTALSMLLDDGKSVSEKGFKISSSIEKEGIVVGIVGENPAFDQLLSKYNIDFSRVQGRWETFQLQVVQDEGTSFLMVIGSDARGAAYGVLELSRLIGVSPWIWWGDVVPTKKQKLALPSNYSDIQSPSVQYRGIFLNDEDWGLMPWSSLTYEPSDRKGQIGPKTYSRIFELLLRLRANTLWPAMHEVSIPFYFTPGNQEAAAKYGILLGTSHCEPLMRNSAREWDVVGKGAYNYVTNKSELLRYWSERLSQLKGGENIFTIGLRGKHDGMMQGVKTLKEHKDVLAQVIPDQRELLKKYIDTDPTTVPQVFIPYKEVLDVYNDGLEVPEDVTLVWCDDNYGYLKHFPTDEERRRTGGNGVYYHVSYWGRPHDYLWLSTINPALLHQQMSLAYDKGVRKLWILNVGDIKPAEYQTELFLDMAWNIDKVNDMGLEKHLSTWLGDKFGSTFAQDLTDIQWEYYRLAYIRKPEHMGNTRVEEQDPSYKLVKDLAWSTSEINQRIKDYSAISDEVERTASKIPKTLQSAFFQLVKYPVQASAQMNNKVLYAQLARHQKASWDDSHRAFDSIVSLTKRYNELENGKWNRIMDYKPRNLAVFGRMVEEKNVNELIADIPLQYVFKGSDFQMVKGDVKLIKGLGYQGKALAIKSGKQIGVKFSHTSKDSVEIDIRLLPNHAVDGKKLRVSVSLDGQSPVEVSYKTEGRSEEWKQNVLRNQAIRRFKLPIKEQRKHELKLTALDEGVILDQVLIY
ncbi:glycosyl hydrolase 115 family protein [Sphingobacterium sp. LRF_L2]|uniref:glycosyl hydrolase 115 family protein n=1 Tax=Sphingobacterium sp. LRF_L2 TaxID=3369421 RepID=UPI003F5E977E